MTNACAFCGRKLGLVMYHYHRRRFCRFSCVEAYTKKRNEERTQWVKSLLRLQ
jgi:recombinational DNA repair protein (RecF pathway)